QGLASPDFQLPAARNWTRSDIDDRARRLDQLADHVRLMGIPLKHPWRGAGVDAGLPQDAQRVGTRGHLLEGAISGLAESGTALAARAGVPCATLNEARQLILLGEVVGRAPKLDPAAMSDPAWTDAWDQIVELIRRGMAYASARRRLEGVFVPEAW